MILRAAKRRRIRQTTTQLNTCGRKLGSKRPITERDPQGLCAVNGVGGGRIFCSRKQVCNGAAERRLTSERRTPC